MTYQQGLLWFLANDQRVPEAIRATVGAWGLPRDEFPDTGGWPHELYVREARRMVSDYVMTEHDCRGTTTVGRLGRPRLVHDGLAQLQARRRSTATRATRATCRRRRPRRIPISYRSIVPRASECANLLVPVCLSSSHIAYGSIRMEPVFMLLGQSAATAAALAIDAGVSVQEVDYAALHRQLRRDRMVLEWPPPAGGLSLDAPELHASEAATVRVTLANDDIEPYENVELALVAPSGWTVEPAAPQAFDRVEPGGELEATWQVTATAADEPAAAHELRVRAAYAVAGTATAQEATEPVYVVEPIAAPYATFASTEAHFGARGDRLAIIAGGADVWVGIDQYGTVFRPRAGGPDTVAMTRLDAQDATDPSARAGLAMRNDLTKPGAGLGYVLLVAKPQNGFLLLWDADGDGYVESVARAGGPVTPYPAWLRLERRGTTFTGAYSTDGTSWTAIGSAVVPTAAAVQDVGLVCCSHSTTLGRALFDGLAISGSG